MANTPYGSLKSEDILAGHISGLQTDVNKIQEVLNMKTGTRSGHALEPVIDQDDPSLRYRIYEATERNWLKTPAPVIFRNGIVVPSEEYILQAPYGVVVFNEQQSSADNVTADFTYILGRSTKIETIDQNVSTLQGDLSTAQGDITALDGRVETLEGTGTGGGSSGGGLDISHRGVGEHSIFAPGSYVSNQRRNVGLMDENDVVIQPLNSSLNILVFGGTMDAFPFPVANKTTFAEAAIMLGIGTGYAVRVRIGIYADNNGRPGALIQGTGDIIVSPGEWGREAFDLTLEPGMYWIVRQDKSESQWNGLEANSVELVQVFDAPKFLQSESPVVSHALYGGYRATGISWTDATPMPATYPASGELFWRDFYASPWLVVG